MLSTIKSYLFILCFFLLIIQSCKKEEFTFGDIKTPTNLSLSVEVVGADSLNPGGDGKGRINVTASSDGAITYIIDYGDSTNKSIESIPSGKKSYTYSSPGEYLYNVTVKAVGTGGAASILTKQIRMSVIYQLDTAIVRKLTNNSSSTWVSNKNVAGHVGVGPTNLFYPDYYAAPPNTRSACLYDDEIKFEKDAINNVYMTVNNKGQSFLIAAATPSYGFSGGDDCYSVNTGGKKKLAFMGATSASDTSFSTRVQFRVPGNGIINFGSGSDMYEILSLTDSTIHLRNIGADGLAWYQKLIKK